MLFIVCILYSPALDKFYIGFTGDPIEERLAKHLANHRGFTGRAKDWIIVYHETFNSKHLAMQREKEIKSWKSKTKIKELINSSTE